MYTADYQVGASHSRVSNAVDMRLSSEARDFEAAYSGRKLTIPMIYHLG